MYSDLNWILFLRYYAISKVIKMKQLSKKKIVLFLVAVWVLSVTNAILCGKSVNFL